MPSPTVAGAKVFTSEPMLYLAHACPRFIGAPTAANAMRQAQADASSDAANAAAAHAARCGSAVDKVVRLASKLPLANQAPTQSAKTTVPAEITTRRRQVICERSSTRRTTSPPERTRHP